MNLNSRSSDFVPFSRPNLGSAEEEAAIRVIRSGWLTTGVECQAFEQEFAQVLGDLNRAAESARDGGGSGTGGVGAVGGSGGVGGAGGSNAARGSRIDGSGTGGAQLHCVALNSATAGLHLALDAVGIQAGDKVLTSPYTFVASAEVVQYLGATVVFADIEPGTFHLDPDRVGEMLDADRSIRAVVAIHVTGCSHRIAELAAICRDRGVLLVEDAAHSFPSATVAGAHGTIGDIGVYSFYANKTITTGEGGMLVTRNPDWADLIRRKRLHGIDREVWNRYSKESQGWAYDVTELGYKYNLPDLAAAIGRVQLARSRSLMAERADIARRYSQAFANEDWLDLPFLGDAGPSLPPLVEGGTPILAGHSWHLYILRFRTEELSISRDEVSQRLRERGIGTSLHFIPLNTMSYYRKLGAPAFPHAEQTSARALSIPLFPGMTDEQVSRVIEELLYIGHTFRRSHGKKPIGPEHPYKS